MSNTSHPTTLAPCWSELRTQLELNFQSELCSCKLCMPDPSLMLNECYQALGWLSVIKRNHLSLKKKKKKETEWRRICQAYLDLPLQSLLGRSLKRQLGTLQVLMTKALLWCPRKQWPQKMLCKVKKSNSVSVWWCINPLANNNHIPFLSTAFLSILRLLIWSSYLSYLFVKSYISIW